MTTITKDTPWRHAGAVPFAIWQKRINDAGGLTEAAGYDVWLACGDDSALMLEFLNAESSYASDFDAIPASYKDPWNLQIDGKGIKFASVADCARAWRERLYSTTYKGGIYTKTQTIYDLISTYAPRSDGNDPDGYAAKVAAGMNRNGFDPPVTVPPGEDPEPIPGEGEPMATRIPVVQHILPTSASNRPGRKLGSGDLYIVIHETDNPNATADAVDQIDYTSSAEARSRQVSYHLSTDDHQTAQGLPLDEIGWHAGDGCDDPSVDIGCFKSVAIERCVNAGRNEEQCLRNVAETIVRIVHGDPAFNWGGGTSKGRFSTERILQHHDVSDEGKDCPHIIRANGWWPKLMQYVDEAEARLYGGTTPAEPTTPAPVEEVLPGLDYAVAARLFGTAKGEDNVTYKFDKNGPVSKLWLANGKQTGQWPALVSVYSYESGARRYFVFQGGATILAAKGSDPRWLKEAA